MASSNNNRKIDSFAFYGEYHGHKVRDLQVLLPALRQVSNSLVWTAGDSSLDNKYWFSASRSAVPGPYAETLDPPVSNADVTYWMNQISYDEQSSSSSTSNRYTTSYRPTINTAVEATTLNERTFRLRSQDIFLRDHIQADDILVVSVGGNDIALCPLPCTIASVAGLVCCTPQVCLRNAFTCGRVPVNDCCCGCGPSLCSCLCACPPCLGYMHHLFGFRIQHYLSQLISKTKPKMVLVCMIYHPDTANVPSWANGALGALGYNKNPQKVQLLIEKFFDLSISTIELPENVPVIPVPLFQVLDGSNTRDYVHRVEPSPQGGKKMAEFIWNLIYQAEERLQQQQPQQQPAANTTFGVGSGGAPTTSYIAGRD